MTIEEVITEHLEPLIMNRQRIIELQMELRDRKHTYYDGVSRMGRQIRSRYGKDPAVRNHCDADLAFSFVTEDGREWFVELRPSTDDLDSMLRLYPLRNLPDECAAATGAASANPYIHDDGEPNGRDWKAMSRRDTAPVRAGSMLLDVLPALIPVLAPLLGRTLYNGIAYISNLPPEIQALFDEGVREMNEQAEKRADTTANSAPVANNI